MSGVGAEWLWVGAAGWKVGWGDGGPTYLRRGPSRLQSSTETGQVGAGVTHPEDSSQCSQRLRRAEQQRTAGPQRARVQSWLLVRVADADRGPLGSVPCGPLLGASGSASPTHSQPPPRARPGGSVPLPRGPVLTALTPPPRSARRTELLRVALPLPALARRRGLRQHAGGVLHGPRLPQRGGHVCGSGRAPVGTRVPSCPRVWSPGV